MKLLKTKEEKLEAMKKIIIEENIHNFLYGGNVGAPLKDNQKKKGKKKDGKN